MPDLNDFEHLDDDPFDEPTFSSWDVATHGPEPAPDWVVTDLRAIDADLGVLKTGKEADVHLVSRAVPDGRDCLLAAKRYRRSEHRMFHRDAAYQEGRSTRRTRDMRAMEGRTDYGRLLLAGHWTFAEFDALGRMWQAGAPVPYPVQCLDTELMLEFIGDADGTAAPRLAQCRPDRVQLRDLFDQCVAAMTVAGPRGVRARRPLAVQPAGPPRQAGHDRHAADRRPRGESARTGVPAPRLPERVRVVCPAWARGRRSGALVRRSDGRGASRW